MDWEGKIGAVQLTCSASGVILNPGDTLYSAIRLAQEGFSRQDFAEEPWPTVDRSAFLSWWKHKVPLTGSQRRPFKLNSETLAQIFANLQGSLMRPQRCLAYVVALGLVRARKWAFLKVRTADGSTVLVLQDRADSTVHELEDPRMTPEEEEQVLGSLLAVTDAGPVDAAPAQPVEAAVGPGKDVVSGSDVPVPAT